MYQASSEYTTVVNQSSRTFKAKIKEGANSIIDGIKTIKYIGGSNGGDSITIGSTVAAYVEIELENPGITLENKEIEVSTGLQLASSVEYIRTGFFTVQKPVHDGNSIKLVAYDRMMRANNIPYFSSLVYPTTAIQMIDEICSLLGITRATIGLGTINISKKLEGYSCREALGYLAGLYGKFACINRDGKLEIQWYSDNNYNVSANRYTVLATNEKNFVVQKIDCSIDKVTTLTSGAGATGISTFNPFINQARLDTIFSMIGNFSYRPGNVTFLGDPRIDPWDIVTVTDLKGITCTIPAMLLSWEYDGGISTTVEAKGKSESASTDGFKGPTTKAIERTYAELMLVNQLIVKKLDVEVANITYANIQELVAVRGRIDNLEATQITVGYLRANYAEINLANIEAGCITTAMISTGAINTAQIADGSITDAKIVGLTANKITAGIIDAGVISVVNLNAANITVGTINGQQIAPGAIDMTNLSESLGNTIIQTENDVTEALSLAGLVQEKIDNLSVGTRNLLLNSSVRTVNSNYMIKSYNMTEKMIVGQEYTIRIKGSLGTGKLGFVAYLNGGSIDLSGLLVDNLDGTYSKTFIGKDGGAITTDFINVYAFYSTVVVESTIEWIKLEKGNSATDWTPAPEETNTLIQTSQTTADSKNTVYYSINAPTGNFKNNDVWFDTDDGFKMYRWFGSSWLATQFGTSAIANLSITDAQIADATISSAKISNLDAGKITTGLLNADRIASLSITADKIASNAITTAKLAAGAITAAQIAVGTITGDKISAGTITSTLIASNAITSDKIVAGAITAAKIAAGTITANEIASNAITTAKIAAGAITAVKINVADLFAQNIVASGTIQSSNYVANTSGLRLDMLTGTIDTKNFKVDSSGNVIANNAYMSNGYFAGEISSTSGTIGGWTIEQNQLYSDYSSNGFNTRAYMQKATDHSTTWIYSIQKGYSSQTFFSVYRIQSNGDTFWHNWTPSSGSSFRASIEPSRNIYSLGTAFEASGYPVNLASTYVQGQLNADNIACGSVSITPTANSPTSATVSYGKTLVGTPTVMTTPGTSAPGSQVLGTSFDNATSTSVRVWVYRTNATALAVHWFVYGR